MNNNNMHDNKNNFITFRLYNCYDPCSPIRFILKYFMNVLNVAKDLNYQNTHSFKIAKAT